MNALWIAAFALGVVWFIEYLATIYLWSFVYRFGIPVWREARQLPRMPSGLNKAFRTTSGAFRPLSENACIFTLLPLSARDLMSGTGLKSTIRWEESSATIEGRIPVSETLLLPTMIVAAAWSASSSGLGPAQYLFVPAFAAIAAIPLMMIPVDIRHARAILDEYEHELEGLDGGRSLQVIRSL